MEGRVDDATIRRPYARLNYFMGIIDKTHRVSPIDVRRDFTYVLMRVGHLIPYGSPTATPNAPGRLRMETDGLFKLIRSQRADR